jgi:hypothetical protein
MPLSELPLQDTKCGGKARYVGGHVGISRPHSAHLRADPARQELLPLVIYSTLACCG